MKRTSLAHGKYLAAPPATLRPSIPSHPNWPTRHLPRIRPQRNRLRDQAHWRRQDKIIGGKTNFVTASGEIETPLRMIAASVDDPFTREA
jgi:hypothetical protein